RGHRERGCLDDGARVFERFVPADRAVAIAPAQRERQSGAGGRQCVKPEVGEQPRGADVPRIGEHENLVALVQAAEFVATTGPFGVIHGQSDLGSLHAGVAPATDKRYGRKTMSGIAISTALAPPWKPTRRDVSGGSCALASTAASPEQT